MRFETYMYEDGLESDRLITSFADESMINDWNVFINDEECMQYFPSYVSEGDDPARTWMERQMDRYKNKKYGLQGIRLKESGALIGQCGLLSQHIDNTDELEVGYSFIRSYWGKGYAPEAARIFLNYAIQHKLADSVISIIDIHNTNSQKVAEKNGLKREKQVEWRGINVYVYRIKA